MKIIPVLILCAPFLCCGKSASVNYDPIFSANNVTSHEKLSTSISVGTLSADDVFNMGDADINIESNMSQTLFQVGLRITDLYGYDPVFLRIKFMSNYTEWIGITNNNITIYDSYDDCITIEEYCENIIVGQGTSGYFEINDGYIALQNAYCRNRGETYAYTISAKVYDIAQWPEIDISNESSIDIICIY